MTSITIPTGAPPRIAALAADSYSVPVLRDEDEWASPTPCHLQWIIRKVSQLEVTGRLDVTCPVCTKPWEVIWDPWRPEAHGHALWVS